MKSLTIPHFSFRPVLGGSQEVLPGRMTTPLREGGVQMKKRCVSTNKREGAEKSRPSRFTFNLSRRPLKSPDIRTDFTNSPNHVDSSQTSAESSPFSDSSSCHSVTTHPPNPPSNTHLQAPLQDSQPHPFLVATMDAQTTLNSVGTVVSDSGTKNLSINQSAELTDNEEKSRDEVAASMNNLHNYMFAPPSNILRESNSLLPTKWEESQKPYVFSSPTPLVCNLDRGKRSHDPVHKVLAEASTFQVAQSPNLLEKIQTEIALRHKDTPLAYISKTCEERVINHGEVGVKDTSEESSQTITLKDRPRLCTSADSAKKKWQRCYNNYSATLGISTFDLPRRALRKCTEEDISGGVVPYTSDSPTILSAALGITHLVKPNSNTGRVGPNWSSPALRTVTGKVVEKENFPPPTVQSCDLDAGISNTPQLNIVELKMNSKPPSRGCQKRRIIPSNKAISSTHENELHVPALRNKPSCVANSNIKMIPQEITVSGLTKPTPTHRFRSPWLRRSLSKNQLCYTPVREGDSISK